MRGYHYVFVLLFILGAAGCAGCKGRKKPVDPNGSNGMPHGLQPPACNISNTPDVGSAWPDIVVDGIGNVHVAWEEGTVDGISEVYYAVKFIGDTLWQEPINISNSGANSGQVEMAVDGNNTVHAVWLEASTVGDIFYSNRPPSGAWSSPANISNMPGTSWEPSIDVDPQNNVHVTWYESGNGCYSRKSGSSWSTPIVVTGERGCSFWDDAVSVAAGKNAYVVWQWKTEEKKREIAFVTVYPDFALSTPIELTHRDFIIPYSPRIAVDGLENIHVGWYNAAYKAKDSTGGWSETLALSLVQYGGLRPDISVGSSQDVYVVWEEIRLIPEKEDSNIICYQQNPPSGTRIVYLVGTTTPTGHPHIAVGPFGKLHFVFHQAISPPDEADVCYLCVEAP
jgi:hypothetical protein